MALNWTAPAQIYELLLHYNKDGEEGTIDLRGGFIAFNYYGRCYLHTSQQS